ncbi:MAG: hypothetical protein QXR53_02495 [Candidatus Norongarragalinales archaeon]
MASPFSVYWSQVHPVFMVAAVGATVVGGLYSPVSNPPNLLVFCAGVFAALYFAHVKDSYVDFFERREDSFSFLTKKQSEKAMALSALGVIACLLYFAFLGFWLAIPIILCGFLLAYFHAPMDLNPVGATAGYPTGLALAMLGGYYVQARATPFSMILFAIAVWLVLNGVKIVDDVKDFDWDERFGKKAAPVFFGKKRANFAGCNGFFSSSLKSKPSFFEESFTEAIVFSNSGFNLAITWSCE